MDIQIKHFWDIFTDKFSFAIIHPQYFIKKYTNNSINLALKHASGILLDIGCGRMPYKQKFLSRVNKYIGLDHPKVAKLYKGDEKPDILADITNIPLPNESCDTITCLQVLEHLPNPAEAINEMYRVLKKNGKIILSTIQFYPLHDTPYDYFRYTQFGLDRLFRQGSLIKIFHRQEGNVFVTIFQSFNIYLMLQLKKAIKNKFWKYLVLLAAPLVLTITTFTNLITFPFLLLDKRSNFTIIHTMVVRKK